MNKKLLFFSCLKIMHCVIEVTFILKASAASSVQMDKEGGRKTCDFFFPVFGKMPLV